MVSSTTWTFPSNMATFKGNKAARGSTAGCSKWQLASPIAWKMGITYRRNPATLIGRVILSCTFAIRLSRPPFTVYRYGSGCVSCKSEARILISSCACSGDKVRWVSPGWAHVVRIARQSPATSIIFHALLSTVQRYPLTVRSPVLRQGFELRSMDPIRPWPRPWAQLQGSPRSHLPCTC